MKLVVNGESRAYDGEATLAGLVASLDAVPERVATMLNGKIVKQDARGAAVLRDGDCVEILSFAGGG